MFIIKELLIPVFAGAIFLYVAFLVKKEKEDSLPFRAGYFGSLFFAIYLLSRPIQILLGKWLVLPIINLRELILEGIVAPSFLIVAVSWAVGETKMRWTKSLIYIIGLVAGFCFALINIKVMGNPVPIGKVGSFVLYDGQWFNNPAIKVNPALHNLMSLLVFIRTSVPVGFSLVAWAFISWKKGKVSVHDSALRRRVGLIGWAVAIFPVSMLLVSLLAVIFGITNQWWIYYLGALISGIFGLEAMKTKI